MKVVIGGIAGRFPQCEDVEELYDSLLRGEDLITEDETRWKLDVYDMPRRMGKLKNMDKFDAAFFAASRKQSFYMDVRLRMLLEMTQAAIMDAGVNPASIRGSKTAVYVGTCQSDQSNIANNNRANPDSYMFVGYSNAMLSNRISYEFDLRGPSLTVDTACSSGLVCLQMACAAIEAGECEAAIVAAACVHPDPKLTYLAYKLGILGPDGRCKTFDSRANGYARSEAVVAVYVSKEGLSKRSYATVLGTRVNTDGYKAEGVTYPSGSAHEELYRELYGAAGVDPAQVSFVEAHGTGTVVGDAIELGAMERFFCAGRTAERPLLIGSSKSNMGHTEPASGLCALVKIIMANCGGKVPRNINFETPNEKIQALARKTLKVVTENIPWPGDIAAVNSFGYGGVNAHAILSFADSRKEPQFLPSELPILIPVCARTSEGLQGILNRFSSQPVDHGVAALWHSINKTPVLGFPHRGYAVLPAGGKAGPVTSATGQPLSGGTTKAPVFFVFSGMGSQWDGMGKDLLKLVPFRESILRAQKFLLTKDFDLLGRLEAGKGFDESLLSTMVGITSVQLALVDLLRAVGITADGCLGHSLGETACGYASGSITLEEALIVTLERAYAVRDTEVPAGAMAAVGLSWEATAELCPPSITIACHNAEESVTVSGLRDEVAAFVKDLQDRKLVVREVNSTGTAFHSKYVQGAGRVYKEALVKAFKGPRVKPGTWISSSVRSPRYAPGDQEDIEVAHYFSNNFISTVYFKEAVDLVPEGAIVIEVAPHALLQSLLKPRFPGVLGITNKRVSDQLSHFLETLGKLYLKGLNPDLSGIYPVQLPLRTRAPPLSPMVTWDHSESWFVPIVTDEHERFGGVLYAVSLQDPDQNFYSHHRIDGKVLVPAAGYLMLVWKVFATLKGTGTKTFPVVFEDVSFESATIIPTGDQIELRIQISDLDGSFGVYSNGDTLACKGVIRTPRGDFNNEVYPTDHQRGAELANGNTEEGQLTSQDFYKYCQVLGYNFSGPFKSILSLSLDGLRGEVKWEKNWVTFWDGIFQLFAFKYGSTHLTTLLPSKLHKLTVNPELFDQNIAGGDGGTSDPVPVRIEYLPHLNTFTCPGVEVRNLITLPINLTTGKKDKCLRLEDYKFAPYFDPEGKYCTDEQIFPFFLDVALGGQADAYEITEFSSSSERALLVQALNHVNFSRLRSSKLTLVLTDDGANAGPSGTVPSEIKVIGLSQCKNAAEANLVITHDPTSSSNFEKSLQVLSPNGFLLIHGNIQNFISDPEHFKGQGLALVSTRIVSYHEAFALYHKVEIPPKIHAAVKVTSAHYKWVETLQRALKTLENEADPQSKLIIYSDDDPFSGILGLVTSLVREPGTASDSIRCFFNKGPDPLKWDFHNPTTDLRAQMDKDLFFNVKESESDGSWGTYTSKSLELTGLAAPRPVEYAGATALVGGGKASLEWVEQPPGSAPGATGDLIDIYYTGLNFKDVMLTSGKINLAFNQPDLTIPLGIEFSGVTRDGRRRVFGTTPSGSRALSTSTIYHKGTICDVPAGWSLADAATVTAVYTTAYVSIVLRARLQAGESILIHGGAGGVGIAAISIALRIGATVYVTVSTAEKREFLKKRFPSLKDSNFSNSRSHTVFEADVMRETRGEGVHVVLNSLSQDSLMASLRCLRENGRFVEIGKYDLLQDTPLRMKLLLRGISFHVVDLIDMLGHATPEGCQVFQLLADGIADGTVQPLPWTCFDYSEYSEAFQVLASGQHKGKIILKIRDESTIGEDPPLVQASPRTYFNPEKVYLLVGGLGGMGLETAKWMVNRGAKKLVFTSRSGMKTGYQRLVIDHLLPRQSGVHVEISTVDVGSPTGAEGLIMDIVKRLGPLGGVFNFAAVLADGLFLNQGEESFELVCASKVAATVNLDKVTRKLVSPPPDLFVVFSSIAAGKGNGGQTNYSFANSTMERIMEARRKDGLHGLAVEWGAVAGVGLLADKEGEIGGTLMQSITSCLEVLDLFLRTDEAVLASLRLPERSGDGGDADDGAEILRTFATIFGFKSLDRIDESKTFAEMGMDSLMTAEIKLQLKKFNLDGVVKKAYAELTFGDIKNLESGGSGTTNATAVKPTESQGGWFGLLNLVTVPLEPLVKLESRGRNGKNLFFVHDMSGTKEHLERGVKELDHSVWAFQCAAGAPLSSVYDLASYYIKLLKSVQPEGPYDLGGYSFGTTVVFEMAAQLEEGGEQVRNVLFWDGSPQKIRQHFLASAGRATLDQETQGMLLLIEMYGVPVTKVIEDQLKKVQGLEGKAEVVAGVLQGKNPTMTPTQVKEAARVQYLLFDIAMGYVPSRKLTGPKCTLLKAIEAPYLSDRELSENYDLEKVCTKLTRRDIKGNHQCFFEKPEQVGVPAVVNEELK